MVSARSARYHAERPVALSGELAVPWTRNPLQRGRIPSEGRVLRGLGPKAQRWRPGSAHWEPSNRVRSGRKQR